MSEILHPYFSVYLLNYKKNETSNTEANISFKTAQDVKRPEIIPGTEIKPEVDIPLILSNLNNADFDMLINVLNIIDDDGCKLRYASDGKGNNYNKKTCFIRADLILDTTQKIYNKLITEI